MKRRKLTVILNSMEMSSLDWLAKNFGDNTRPKEAAEIAAFVTAEEAIEKLKLAWNDSRDYIKRDAGKKS